MLVSAVMGNRQSLDGGAMFGNVPRALWQRWCPPDEQGRIALGCRAFLVEYDDKKLLIEAGVGAFFEPKLAERFGVVEPDHRLLASLAALGVAPGDIDIVLLSHLHFDHAGGIVSQFEVGKAPELVFPKARFLVSRTAFERANHPHKRDRASFVPEIVDLLKTSGRLELLDDMSFDNKALDGKAMRHPLLGDAIELSTSDGHTPGMVVSTLMGSKYRATFCADLIPGIPWVHLPVTMGYDRYPELVIDEKQALYERYGLGHVLLFTHEPKHCAGRLTRDQSGKYGVELLENDSANGLVRWDLDAPLGALSPG